MLYGPTVAGEDGETDQTVILTDANFPVTVMATAFNLNAITGYQHLATFADNSGQGSLAGPLPAGQGNPSECGILLVGTPGIRLNRVDHAGDLSQDVPLSALSAAQRSGLCRIVASIGRDKADLWVDAANMIHQTTAMTGSYFTQDLNISYGTPPGLGVCDVFFFSGYASAADVANYQNGMDCRDIAAASANRLGLMPCFPLRGDARDITRIDQGYVNSLHGNDGTTFSDDPFDLQSDAGDAVGAPPNMNTVNDPPVRVWRGTGAPSLPQPVMVIG